MGQPGPPGENGAMVRSKSGFRLCSQGHLFYSTHAGLLVYCSGTVTQQHIVEMVSPWFNVGKMLDQTFYSTIYQLDYESVLL